MKILAMSGSLREKSYNTAIIQALKELETENISIEIYSGLGKLPFFTPDLDEHTLEVDNSPLLVQELRKKILDVDAIIISTPEYAFEIPGVLKNGLDWLVSSSVIVNKPISVISASTSAMGGDKAHKVLTDLMIVLSGKIVYKSNLIVSRVNKKIDDRGEVIDDTLLNNLKVTIKELDKYIKDINI